MFSAQVLAWRRACCAVGGEMFPSTCLIAAQSPIAQTPGQSGTSVVWSTTMRPLSCGNCSAVRNQDGVPGTVATALRVPFFPSAGFACPRQPRRWR